MRYRTAAHTIKTVTLLSAMLLLGGCATVFAPPITEESTDLNFESNGIALVGLTLSNTFRVSPLISPLKTSGIRVVHLTPVGKETQIFFEAGKPISKSSDSNRQVEEHMLSVKLPPGQYKLVCVLTTVAELAYGCAPVCVDFIIVAHKIAYLGHLDITRRERKNDDEISAGFLLPLFDQWYAGFSTGTFDVAIRDNFEQDIPTFQQRYRVLSGHSVDKTLLPKLANLKFDILNDRCGE